MWRTRASERGRSVADRWRWLALPGGVSQVPGERRLSGDCCWLARGSRSTWLPRAPATPPRLPPAPSLTLPPPIPSFFSPSSPSSSTVPVHLPSFHSSCCYQNCVLCLSLILHPHLPIPRPSPFSPIPCLSFPHYSSLRILLLILRCNFSLPILLFPYYICSSYRFLYPSHSSYLYPPLLFDHSSLPFTLSLPNPTIFSSWLSFTIYLPVFIFSLPFELSSLPVISFHLSYFHLISRL